MSPLKNIEKLTRLESGEGTSRWSISNPRIGVRSLADICSTEYPQSRWIAEGLIPEGLTLLCGKPKVGKSWLCLDIGIAITNGGLAFGSARTDRGDALYLALEDSPRRLKSRTLRLLNRGGSPPKNFFVKFEAPPLGEGLEDFIESWMGLHPETRGIFIDTLARVRPNGIKRDWYTEDTAWLAPLQRIAGELNIGIVAVGHTRKMGADDPVDMVSGSVGLTGVADTIVVLTRSRGKTDGELFITGRDTEERALALDRRGVRWVIAGDAELYRMEDTRRAIVELLSDSGASMHFRDIATGVDITEQHAKVTLGRMVSDDQIRREGDGFYTAVPVTAVTPLLTDGNAVTQVTDSFTSGDEDSPQPDSDDGSDHA